MRRIGSGLTPGVADGATAVLRALALGGWATSRSLGWKVGQCPGNIGSVDSVAARLSLLRSLSSTGFECKLTTHPKSNSTLPSRVRSCPA